MILERLSKIEKLKENIIRNPETIVELLKEKYEGMDFKITCKKRNGRKNKKITDDVVNLLFKIKCI
jgi:hypothetical protein